MAVFKQRKWACAFLRAEIVWKVLKYYDRRFSLQAEEVKRRFGSVDILVNNAGVVCGKSLLECQADEIRYTIDVNLMSQFWASSALYFINIPGAVSVFYTANRKKNTTMFIDIQSSGRL